MKKIFIYIIALTILATSCVDKVEEIAPVDVLDARNVFTSVADLETGINGVYDTYNQPNVIQHSSIFGDDTRIGADNGGQGIPLHNWIVDPGSNSQPIWGNCYYVITMANKILEAAEKIKPKKEEQEKYNVVIGEALAWRGFAHLVLMSFYSPEYKANTMAVPYIKTVIVFEQPKRNTVAEVAAGIKADLDKAEGLLPTDGDVGRFNDDVLNAIRARLALYTGDYATALSLAEKLVAKYPLANQVSLRKTFQDTSEAEIIWKLTKTQNDGRVSGVWYFTGTGGAFFEMSRGFFESMDKDDIRYKINVDIKNTNDAKNELFIGKYLGKDGIQYLNDIKMFRSAEMQLIIAEAKAQNSDFAGAGAAIDKLRDLRFGADQPAPVYANLAQAIEDIVKERRVELAYEGHRFIDLKRTRDITKKGLVRDQSKKDCGGATPCNLDLSDRRWAIAIPIAEMNGNKNMIQNPGYKK